MTVASSSQEGAGQPAPYADHAPWMRKHWPSVLPLPARQKHPVPTGFTGYQGRWPKQSDYERWGRLHATGNLALRLPKSVVGLDLDLYKDDSGEALRWWTEQFGSTIPDTWMSTSRDDGSGIRLYRVEEPPASWHEPQNLPVEVIHPGHRYVVAPGSIHPEGRQYRWVHTGTGELAAPGEIGPGDLSKLWAGHPLVEFLGSARSPAVKASVDEQEVQRWLAAQRESEGDGPCRAVAEVLRTRFALSAAGAASRHNMARTMTAQLVRLSEQGHRGAVSALAQLRGTFISAVTGPGAQARSESEAEGEWRRMVTGAYQIVAADPTPEADRGCCGSPQRRARPERVTAAQGVEHDEEAGDEPAIPGSQADWLEPLWEREVLASLRDHARAALASPLAAVALGLQRASLGLPYWLVLPPIVGAEASLNTFVALMGAPGMGKGAVSSIVQRCIQVDQRRDFSTQLGTGEGLLETFGSGRIAGENDQSGRAKGDRYTKRHRYSALFSVPEVDTLDSLGRRTGATIWPTLRSAWSGERLGFSNRDAERSTQLDAHSYRLCLWVGVQPGRGRAILSAEQAAAGTPQRFLWAPAWDADADAGFPAPDRAGELVQVPRELVQRSHDGGDTKNEAGTALVHLDVPQSVRTEIRETQVARMRAGVSEDAEAIADGHWMLTRLKLAAILGLLEGREGLDEQDWSLAGIIMEVSDRTRRWTQAKLASEQELDDHRAALRAGEAQATATVRSEARLEHRAYQRCLKLLREAAPESLDRAELRERLSSYQREHLDTVMAKLEADGLVDREERPHGGNGRQAETVSAWSLR